MDLAAQQHPKVRPIPLRVMVMEDSTTEAQELIEPLHQAGYAITASRVKSILEFQVCLKKQDWDLILSSARLNDFSPQQALALLAYGKRDIPVVIVAPMRIKQEEAVEFMTLGARDVVLKNQPERMIAIVQRELKDLAQRRARAHFETLARLSERAHQQLLNAMQWPTALMTRDGRFIHSNAPWGPFWGQEMSLERLKQALPIESSEMLERLLQGLAAGSETSGVIATRVQAADAEHNVHLEAGLACYQEHPCLQIVVRTAAVAAPAPSAGPKRPAPSLEVVKTDERKPANVEHDANIRRVLDTAIVAKRFRLVYQPIVNLHAEVTENYEVLVRMLGEDGEEIMPGLFMPVAEQAGLMGAVDRCVISQAVEALAERRQGGRETNFFVKLSEDSLQDQTLVNWVHGQIAAAGLPMGSLVFEIKESSAMALFDSVQKLIQSFRKIGCRVALDHFGTHADSLLHLDKLPVEFIRLAGSFVDRLGDPKTEAAIKVIVQAARAKETKTVATFVQEATNLTTLWQCGVDYIQGYFLQRPDAVLTYDFSV